MVPAAVLFILSCVGIAAIFALKYWERRQSRELVPEWRDAADAKARELKVLLANARRQAEKVPPLLVVIARYAIHEAALGIARLARGLEARAHTVADMVSHRRGFERRAPKNEFLKRVQEYKKGSGLDADDHSGHNA